MAFTVTVVDQNVVGKHRERILRITADAASGVIDSGFGRVLGYAMAPVSVTTGGFKLRPNLNAASAASLGNIMASSCTNGDDFFLIVRGV